MLFLPGRNVGIQPLKYGLQARFSRIRRFFCHGNYHRRSRLGALTSFILSVFIPADHHPSSNFAEACELAADLPSPIIVTIDPMFRANSLRHTARFWYVTKAHSPPEPPRRPSRLLRRADQAVVAGFVLAGLASVVGWWGSQGGFRGRLIEVHRAEPRAAAYQVDLNAAQWPELIQIPGIGPTLARRIVESRETDGPFLDHADLMRVRGIGPKTLEAARPYLRPMPDGNALAGP